MDPRIGRSSPRAEQPLTGAAVRRRRASSPWPVVLILAVFALSRFAFLRTGSYREMLAGASCPSAPEIALVQAGNAASDYSNTFPLEPKNLAQACYPFVPNLWWYHYVDYRLLRSDLLRSLYYLHDQPPGLNALLGVSLKLFSNWYTVGLQVVFVTMGLVLALALFTLMRELGVPVWISAAATCAFELSPATVVIENWYYDTYPTTFCLCVAALCLLRFLRGRGRFYGIGFVILTALPIFFNSSYQIVWFVGVAAILGVLARERLKGLAGVSLAVLAMILMLYGKNLVLFDSFTTSSWLGMNLARITTFQLPKAERVKLVEQGRLSRFALIGPFSNVVRYPAAAATGIPVLDEKFKPDGWSNYNNLVYLRVSRLYLRDALWVIRHRPLTYLSNVIRAVGAYFIPTFNYGYFREIGYLRIPRWQRLADALLRPFVISLGKAREMSVVLLIGMPLLFLFGVARTWCEIRRDGFTSAEALTVVFMLTGIAYISVIGSLFDIGENERFRFVVDPFYVTLAGMLLTAICAKIRARVAKAESAGSEGRPARLTSAGD